MVKAKLAHWIYWQLTYFRDKNWVPTPIVDAVDWLRYGWLFNYSDLEDGDWH